jgi:hypothetical protein
MVSGGVGTSAGRLGDEGGCPQASFLAQVDVPAREEFGVSSGNLCPQAARARTGGAGHGWDPVVVGVMDDDERHGRRGCEMAGSDVSWLHEACPSWCLGGHSETDCAEDREHQSQIYELPAVLLSRTYPGAGRLEESTRATVIDVVRHRRVGSTEEWVFIGDDDCRIDMSLESASRLVSVLMHVIES